MRRTARRLVLFLGSSALVASGFTWGLWTLFPFEQLGRTSFADRFFLWEGLVWMVGLSMLLFGTAAAIGSLGLARTRMPGLDEVHTFSREVRQRPLVFSAGAFWVVLTGALLLAIAVHARFSYAG